MVLGFLFLLQGFSVDLPNPGKPRSEISAVLLAIWDRQAVSRFTIWLGIRRQPLQAPLCTQALQMSHRSPQ